MLTYDNINEYTHFNELKQDEGHHTLNIKVRTAHKLFIQASISYETNIRSRIYSGDATPAMPIVIAITFCTLNNSRCISCSL